MLELVRISSGTWSLLRTRVGASALEFRVDPAEVGTGPLGGLRGVEDVFFFMSANSGISPDDESKTRDDDDVDGVFKSLCDAAQLWESSSRIFWLSPCS